MMMGLVQAAPSLLLCGLCPAPVGLYRAALIPLTLQHYARTLLLPASHLCRLHTVFSEHESIGAYMAHCTILTPELRTEST